MSSSDGRLIRLANLTTHAGENLNRAEAALRQLDQAGDASQEVECLAGLVKELAVTVLGIAGQMQEAEEERLRNEAIRVVDAGRAGASKPSPFGARVVR
jgi:hypothetical protein